jgi:RNA recognition motif-containing protein
MNTKIIFCSNLDRSLGEKELKDFFSSFGPVESVQLKTDVESGASKGFAFCRFEEVAVAANANDKLNGFEFMGLRLTCNPVTDKVLIADSASRTGVSFAFVVLRRYRLSVVCEISFFTFDILDDSSIFTVFFWHLYY